MRTLRYTMDEKGILTKVNLIVGTTNSYAPIYVSIGRAALGLIKRETQVTRGTLNVIEMAFRANDPCFGCATHALPERRPFVLHMQDGSGEVLERIWR